MLSYTCTGSTHVINAHQSFSGFCSVYRRLNILAGKDTASKVQQLDAIRAAISNRVRISTLMKADCTMKASRVQSDPTGTQKKHESCTPCEQAAVWDLDRRIRLLAIVLMEPENRSSLAATGSRASRKDLDSGDAKKLSIWQKFAAIMNDDLHLVTSGQLIRTRTFSFRILKSSQ